MCIFNVFGLFCRSACVCGGVSSVFLFVCPPGPAQPSFCSHSLEAACVERIPHRAKSGSEAVGSMRPGFLKTTSGSGRKRGLRQTLNAQRPHTVLLSTPPTTVLKDPTRTHRITPPLHAHHSPVPPTAAQQQHTKKQEHGTLENLGMVFLRLQRSGSFYTADAPPSDGSREGSRRSNLNAFSGRSARVLSGASSTGAGGGVGGRQGSSQLDLFNPADLQLPERWRSRGGSSSSRNERALSGRSSLSKAASGHSSRSDVAGGSSRFTAAFGGGGGGGGAGGGGGLSGLGRGLKPSNGGSTRSIASAPPPSRPKPLARVYPRSGGGGGGGSSSSYPDTGGGGAGSRSSSTDHGGEDEAPCPSPVLGMTASEGLPCGRAALLQRGRGLARGFPVSEDGGAGGGGGGGGAFYKNLTKASAVSLTDRVVDTCKHLNSGPGQLCST